MERVHRTPIGEIAEKLYQQPAAADYEKAPILLEEPSSTPLSAENRASRVRAALNAIEDRLGPATQYGGSGRGPSVRWKSANGTLVLDQGSGGLQLSIHISDELDRREVTIFRQGVGTSPHQVATYDDLPYLWQLNRTESGAAEISAAQTPPASDWPLLEQSVRSLLAALSDQLPAQLGAAGVGFNFVNHADGDRTLGVLCSPDDELMALLDTTDSPDQGSPGHAEYESGMLSRGWHSWIPVARWWEASFPLGVEGASALAALVVGELRHRSAGRPINLGLSDLSVNEVLDAGGLGPELGQLFLPGLGINY
ncbi:MULTISPECIES: hypothetical protein [unclassified Streptomyces]|uniref:hypothetical protein n=1 Tax=unclassified Streptomyces TaxID=2593676 RepID=UPI0011B09F1C|nr:MULTISPECIES: hypothetical protein [unclassified Streptomyces]